ncbi:MAG: MGMT family protein [Fimbriimonadaceae bacterium]
MINGGPETVYEMVRAIPEGRVTSYGALGQALKNPVSGLVVGNWMSRCPDDVPWWRVIAKDGRIVIFKKDAAAALVQRKMLEDEGIEFGPDEKVKVEGRIWDPRFD